MHVLSISPRSVTRILAGTVILLVTSNTVGLVCKFYLGRDWVFGLVPLFALDGEANIPTFYSAMMLLACSGLLGLIAIVRGRESDGFSWHWAGLGCVFLLLSVDEASQIHELLNGPVRNAVGAGGVFYFAWVIPGLVAVTFLGIVYLKFMFSLPSATRWLFFTAAALFLGGALGVEMLGAWWAEGHRLNNPTYALLATAEETLEMLGVLAFFYALLRYVQDHVGEVHLRLGPERNVAGTLPLAGTSAGPAGRAGFEARTGA